MSFNKFDLSKKKIVTERKSGNEENDEENEVVTDCEMLREGDIISYEKNSGQVVKDKIVMSVEFDKRSNGYNIKVNSVIPSTNSRFAEGWTIDSSRLKNIWRNNKISKDELFNANPTAKSRASIDQLEYANMKRTIDGLVAEVASVKNDLKTLTRVLQKLIKKNEL